jgi:hypothetical protein
VLKVALLSMTSKTPAANSYPNEHKIFSCPGRVLSHIENAVFLELAGDKHLAALVASSRSRELTFDRCAHRM